MYLKALEIQGFKSFPDKIKITVDSGITAVVGPNGSGKSNISDAIRWVMGETSVKQLRGGSKMEDVIFDGTIGKTKRGAMGYASVRLIVDNSDHRIQVDADEVAIGRKYYRSGESEYSINGQSVRLKDVYELLLDTGLGRDGYSVIGQGRIDEIVASKSAERREIFEEASGIARFRYRKNEAERRLAATEDNLVRLRDIEGELQARVGPLKKESERAQKFLEYAAERKTLDVTLLVDAMHSCREQLRTQQRKIEAAQADCDAKERELNDIYGKTEGVRDEINRLAADIDIRNEDIRTLQEDVASRDARVAVLHNNIQHNERSIRELEEEIAQSTQAEQQIKQQISENISQSTRAQDLLKKTQESIEKLETELWEIKEKSAQSGTHRGKLSAHLAEASERITELKVSMAGAQSTSESVAHRLEGERASLAVIDADIEKLQEQEAGTQEYLQQTNMTLTRLANMKEGMQLKLNARTKALTAAQQQQADVVRKEENAAQRITMLQELERSLDGFQHSVKSVVKAARSSRLRGVIGPVSTIMSVRQGYEVAVETALGYALQNVVVESEEDAKAAMAWLKQNNAGRATFLPLNTVKPQRMDTSRLPEGALSAKGLVEYDVRYENIVSSLLERIVVVDNINDASRVARALDFRNRVVTRDGQLINAGGSFTGGSVSRTTGLFSRKQELAELEASLHSLAQKKREYTEQAQTINAEVTKLNAEITALGSEEINAGGDKIRCETELSRIEESIRTAQKNRMRISEECESLAEQTARAKTEHTLAQTEQARLLGEVQKLSTELERVAGNDDGLLQKRQVLNEEIQTLRLSALTHERDVALCTQRMEVLNSQTSERQVRAQMLLASAERMREQNTQSRSDIEAVCAQAQSAKERAAAIKAEIEEKIRLRLEKEGSITEHTAKERTVTGEREALRGEIIRLSEQKAAFEARHEEAVAKLWEEYELTPGSAGEVCIEFSSASELRGRLAQVKNKIRSLGNVNVGAIEEYAEVSERYEFLSAQMRDVEKSKAELERMIAEISAEMSAMFAQSFEDINNNFKRIFTELFGGGSGSLSLTDPQNLLESGIEIDVAPPGKIIKNLSALSGGEKALVAICIYFSILAVNPAPFCVLDEIEASLDDANVTRFAQYLRRISGRTQFVIITHRRGTMEEADVLYGVTMQEDGVSKLLRLNANEVDASLVR